MSGLTKEQNYCFVVRAQDALGNTETNIVEKCVTTTLEEQAPSAPTEVATQILSNSIKITWSTSERAVKYVLGWNNDNTRNFTEIDRGTNMDYLHEITQYNKYYYAVKACNSQEICSEWSFIGTSGNVFGEPAIKPSKPILEAQAGNAFVLFNITINATPPTTYYFYRGATQSQLNYIGKCQYSPCINRDVENGTTYYYKTVAENLFGTSEYSDTVSITPSADGLQTVQGSIIILPPIFPPE